MYIPISVGDLIQRQNDIGFLIVLKIIKHTSYKTSFNNNVSDWYISVEAFSKYGIIEANFCESQIISIISNKL
jgi:hypothetical protein